MIKKKVLFVTENFFPDISATGICAYNVAYYFLKMGWDVTVLSKKKYKTWDSFQKYHGINIQRIFPPFYEMNSSNKIINLFNKFIYNIISLINLPIWPIKSRIVIKRYASRIVELDKKEKYNYIIFIVNPPFSLEINYYIKEKKKYNYNGKVILYYLDMLMNECKCRYLSIYTSNKKVYSLERRCLPLFDMFFLIDSHKGIYDTAKYDFVKNKVYVNLPSLDMSKLNKDYRRLSGSNIDEINIVYAGTIDAKRNPMPIIKIFKKISEKYKIKIILSFYGKKFTNFSIDCTTRYFKAKYNGQVDRNKIDDIYISADYLLNIENINQNMIPSKIYEFISVKKPIINFSLYNNSIVNKCLKKYKHFITINYSKEIMKNDELRLVSFINNERKKTIDSKIILNNYKSNTPIDFYDIINRYERENN